MNKKTWISLELSCFSNLGAKNLKIMSGFHFFHTKTTKSPKTTQKVKSEKSWISQNTSSISGFSRTFFSRHLRGFSCHLRVFSHQVRVGIFSGYIRFRILILSPGFLVLSPGLLFSRHFELDTLKNYNFCRFSTIFRNIGGENRFPWIWYVQVLWPPNIAARFQKFGFWPLIYIKNHCLEHELHPSWRRLTRQRWFTMSSSHQLRQDSLHFESEGNRIAPHFAWSLNLFERMIAILQCQQLRARLWAFEETIARKFGSSVFLLLRRGSHQAALSSFLSETASVQAMDGRRVSPSTMSLPAVSSPHPCWKNFSSFPHQYLKKTRNKTQTKNFNHLVAFEGRAKGSIVSGPPSNSPSFHFGNQTFKVGIPWKPARSWLFNQPGPTKAGDEVGEEQGPWKE